MGSTGLGLLVEEHRGEIVAAWREGVRREIGVTEPALAFAAAPLVRELGLALGGQGDERRSEEARTRCAVLVRSNAAPAQLAREFKVLHRCMWDALRARGAPVSQADRRAADEWLDDALVEALERLERVRLRLASFDRVSPRGPGAGTPSLRHDAAGGAAAPVAGRAVPPPLPPRSRATPPPLRKAVKPEAEPAREPAGLSR